MYSKHSGEKCNKEVLVIFDWNKNNLSCRAVDKEKIEDWLTDNETCKIMMYFLLLCFCMRVWDSQKIIIMGPMIALQSRKMRK